MSRVLWSAQSRDDLENIAPAVREEIIGNAEETLPDIQHCTGQDGAGVLWHRGITHEQEREVDGDSDRLEDGEGSRACDYYLFYRELKPGEFEVFGVASTHQMAGTKGHLAWEPPEDEPPERRRGHQEEVRRLSEP